MDVTGGAGTDSDYVFDLGEDFAVDARPFGNKTRRMNHCGSHPNVRCSVVNHRGIRKVAMYTSQPVAEGEELEFDYGPLWDQKM